MYRWAVYLLGGEVGQKEGSCDNHATQAASGKEVALFGVIHASPGEAPGKKGDEAGKEKERKHCWSVHGGLSSEFDRVDRKRGPQLAIPHCAGDDQRVDSAGYQENLLIMV